MCAVEKGSVVRAAGLLAVIAWACAQAVAQGAEPADPWLAWADAETLELAAVADRMGEAFVLDRLRAGVSVPAQLAAVRAAPFIGSPERALDRLAELAGSRDPDLAPIAARRALQVAQALMHEGLSRREIVAASLSPAKAALARAAGIAQPRADIRLGLQHAVQLLAALGVP